MKSETMVSTIIEQSDTVLSEMWWSRSILKSPNCTPVQYRYECTFVTFDLS